MRQHLIFLASLVFMFLASCQSENNSTNNTGKPVSHEAYSALLQKHVSQTGKVNYQAFLKDSAALNQYLKTLQEHSPSPNWSQPDQIAYWINAYNAFTIQLILRHYPVSSIKDIGNKIQVPFINTPWDIAFIKINNKKIDLNEIEHGILRRQFAEPRIHFAIVCASVSCPKLRTEAYSGAHLNDQLNEQAQTLINDSSRNQIQPEEIKLSKIFSWFKADFTRKGSLIDFLNQYSKIKIKPSARISTLTYNWRLNE